MESHIDATTAAHEAPDSLLLLPPVIPHPRSPDSVNLFNKSCEQDGWYSLWRKDCGPTLYASNKTPVTVDVLEVGLLFATGIIAVGLFALCLGVRGQLTVSTLYLIGTLFKL